MKNDLPNLTPDDMRRLNEPRPTLGMAHLRAAERVTARENARDVAEWEADMERALRDARKELAARLSPAMLAVFRQAGCQV